MVMTARSSIKVNAAAGRRGVKPRRRSGRRRGAELRKGGVKLPRLRAALARGFWILNFGLCRGEKVRMRKSSFALNVKGFADLA